MRLVFVVLASLVLAQCATSEDTRFRVGESQRAFVVMGVAEAASETSPIYHLLWRRVGPDGRFTEFDDDTIFAPRTHMRNSVRVRGIPGEFAMAEIEPGVYALDSVFAIIRDRRVNYSANGVIRGPERPAFEVRPGEAIFLGIWQADLEDVTAVARPWRLDEADARAALREADAIIGNVRLRSTHTISVPCDSPYRVSPNSLREVC